jgi:hypothetical protein
MSHSLEHLNHPLTYMRYVLDNYTHPGSHIFIEVPNIDIEKPMYLPHHPLNFNADTLNGLFERLGCEVVYDSFHGMNHIMGQANIIGIYKRIA